MGRNVTHKKYLENAQFWLKMLKGTTNLGECDTEERRVLKC
jgi:hypothetical protein